ncbi:MAG: hypothetical protein N2663_02145, partial [Chlorobi bacterium]|nr:hypothetical protein [Chlorobiota bacterium]
MVLSIVYVVVLILAAAHVTAAVTPYHQLVERLRRAMTLECHVITGTNERMRIIAARGGKFRMESAQRIVVSNGEVVWNYVPTRTTVTVSSANSGSSATFDRIAFELIERYRITESSPNRVILLPSEKTLYGVRRIVLEFRKQKLAAIVVEHSGGQEQWQIRSLR